MARNIPLIRIPDPPPQWSRDYVREMVRTIEGWMRRVVANTEEEVAATAFSEITSSTSAGGSDGFFLVDTTGGNVTVTLPDPSTVVGREFMVKRKDASGNTLTVDTASGNIDGVSSKTIASQYDVLRLKSDGTDYWLF